MHTEVELLNMAVTARLFDGDPSLDYLFDVPMDNQLTLEHAARCYPYNPGAAMHIYRVYFLDGDRNVIVLQELTREMQQVAKDDAKARLNAINNGATPDF